jgi:hypothetical protein
MTVTFFINQTLLTNLSPRSKVDKMDTIIFQSFLVSIGLFRVKPWESQFEDSGSIQGYLLVFPRTSVTITHGMAGDGLGPGRGIGEVNADRG